MPTGRALLLIAGIGGYTEYMRSHRSVLGHAEAATSRLLDQTVGAAQGFALIEIEDDTAFVARDASGLGGPAALMTVSDAAVAMHRAFHAERHLIELNVCPCASCKHTSGLRLTFVAHVGEVATQTIRRGDKLDGADVVYVHRLLENSVDVPEYLLVSDELLGRGGSAATGLVTQQVVMDLEGIGPVQTHVADVADMAPPAPLPDPSWPRRIGGTFAMLGRGLPHIIRRRGLQAVVPTG